MSIVASAQDTTVKSRTQIKTDEATAVSMTGCLERNLAGDYSLFGTAVKGKDGVTTETKVRTDNDKDESKVTTEARTRADGPVGTAGALSTFMLVPRAAGQLSKYVGQQVQISAVMVDRDHKDADVKVEERTTVDPEHSESKTNRSSTKIEVEREPVGHYTVVSVTPLGSACE
jgi:hypothetical protein